MFQVFHRFSSHMVLQQRQPVVIAGTAAPGSRVAAEFAATRAEALTDADGKWRIVLPPHPASAEPRTLTVSGPDGETAEFTDVVVGEVWIASGQSNMELPVYMLPEHQAITADAEHHPNLRWINLSRTAASKLATLAFSPTEDIPEKIQWQKAGASSVNSMSAVAWYFAVELEKHLPGVPIGILHLSLGGSPVEAWTSLDGFERGGEAAFARQVTAALAAAPADASALSAPRPPEFLAWLAAFRRAGAAAAEKLPADWSSVEFDDSSWHRQIRPVALKHVGITRARATCDLPPEWAGRDLVISLGFSNDCDFTCFNGEPIGKTDVDVPDYWLHQRSYFIPGRLVRPGRNVIALRVENHMGEGVIAEDCQLYDSRIVPADDPANALPLPEVWRTQTEYIADLHQLGQRPNPSPACIQEFPGEPAHVPAALFNALINPWTDYPIRGVIWYQGCANAGDPRYFQRLQTMIADWRYRWHNPAMPFYQVQLAGFEGEPPKQPGETPARRVSPPEEQPDFALAREIQAEVAALPHNGLATALDVGEPYDIHPKDKRTPGTRLAQAVAQEVYGRLIPCRGPEFERFDVLPDGSVKVRFRHAESGLTTTDGKAPGAFALRGEDGKLHWAEARIEGDAVIVKSTAIHHPTAVRYAFVSYRDDINLCNRDGFPALPFRSDKPRYC